MAELSHERSEKGELSFEIWTWIRTDASEEPTERRDGNRVEIS